MPTTVLRTRDGKLDAGDEAALAALGARLSQGTPRVLLYLHGGLVTQTSAEAAAARLAGAGADGFAAAAECEQIYVIWRTGALETLRTNWQDIFENDRLYKALFKRLIGFIGGKVRVGELGGRSLADGTGLSPAEIEARLASGDDQPFADVDAVYIRESGTRAAVLVDDRDARGELKNELEHDDDFTQALDDIEAALAQGHPTVSRRSVTGDPVSGARSLDRLDNKITGEWRLPDGPAGSPRGLSNFGFWGQMLEHAVEVGMAVLVRYRKQRDHGLHATIAEEMARKIYGDLIGSMVWGMMKTDAADHFVETAAGDALLKLIEANPGVRLVVVGHSAGSIFATQLLKALAQRGGPATIDVVFLAPAVRIQEFAAVLETAADRIGRFRMFTMDDASERRDPVLGKGFGFLYPSSLLYLIAGLFEQGGGPVEADVGLVGMQRFLQGDTDWLEPEEANAIATVRAFLAAQPDRTVYSPSAEGAAAGLSCVADSHGGFDNEPKTLASVATFLA